MTAAIEFRGVTRAYGALRAVDDLTMQIQPGEFFAMLGPSGSGKTTCLRLVAGFERPDVGKVLLEGQDVSSIPPNQRSVNTVFQDYALFPHLNVLDNVAYGPMVKGVAREPRHARAREMLALVQLESLALRLPAQLSGGQRQRVALARALINEPRVLLLDEPLGALDLKLREEMQLELKALQRRLGITFVYVTHDQGEALSMSDRVAVFNAGKIEQLSTPQELYSNPRTAFVARFVGGANVIDGALAGKLIGEARAFALRAEDINVLQTSSSPPTGTISLDAELMDVQYHGATSRWLLRLENGTLLSATRASDQPALSQAPGSRVRLAWKRDDIVLLEA